LGLLYYFTYADSLRGLDVLELRIELISGPVDATEPPYNHGTLGHTDTSDEVTVAVPYFSERLSSLAGASMHLLQTRIR
jgi:hypothetical protein